MVIVSDTVKVGKGLRSGLNCGELDGSASLAGVAE